MELASAPLNPYYAVSSVRATATASRNLYPSRPILRATIPRISSCRLASKSTGFIVACQKVIRLRGSYSAACVGSGTAAVPELDQEHMSLGSEPNPEANDGAFKKDDEDRDGRDSEQLDDEAMVRISDKLIEVFMVDKRTLKDWRLLLIFSKNWDNIRPHFYKRCKDRADSESDPGMKVNLLRLARKLKEVDEDIQRHNELLGEIKKSPSEVGGIIAKRRKDFTKEFFVHLHYVTQSYNDNPTEKEALEKLRNACLAAVEAYDTATESMEALKAVELELQDIINSPSVDVACRKIDDLAKKNQLDSATANMITKAWSAAKDTDMTKEEAQDALFHLYKIAVGNIQRLLPKEVRILKCLLMIEDPEERLGALNDAFTPGPEIEGTDIDYLYTTPQMLHHWIRMVVDAYNNSKDGTSLREAKDLMNPKVIPKLEELRKIIEDEFM